MAAEWVEVRYDGGLASLAMVKGYSVTADDPGDMRWRA